ncbi:NAD(P)/FAD-dependent oxidoreductase [Flavisolibacter sp. BT320]|nr:NAD(P)/FAD-dependent oxidoreductase [Flavisolibacter longurius]
MAHRYDVVVVGSGPNGLAAAIALQQKGLSVKIVEAKPTVGGGMRSLPLTHPGFLHDVCSAVHPLALYSPFFKTLPLEKYGLEWVFPDIALAHPFTDGKAAILNNSIEETAESLSIDASAYKKFISPLVKSWDNIGPDLLGPLSIPSSPFQLANFGRHAIRSATGLANSLFKGDHAKGLFAGLAAHTIKPLEHSLTSAIGLVLLVVGHKIGWPFPKGGTQALADALAAYFVAIGGEIETGKEITSLRQLDFAKIKIFDLTPRQLLNIEALHFPSLYKKQLERYQYGPGVFKIDYALSEPLPFTAPACNRAGTVHLGGTIEEIAKAEKDVWQGRIPERPFILLSQPTVFDKTRAPENKHTCWAYCHVPSGSDKDMTTLMEQQIERFAPGFRDLVLARHTMTAKEVEAYNPNYIGGDITGGVVNLRQLFTRPAIRVSPYATPLSDVYICSSATPPGAGVHGMCGYHAAKKVARDHFR